MSVACALEIQCLTRSRVDLDRLYRATGPQRPTISNDPAPRIFRTLPPRADRSGCFFLPTRASLEHQHVFRRNAYRRAGTSHQAARARTSAQGSEIRPPVKARSRQGSGLTDGCPPRTILPLGPFVLNGWDSGFRSLTGFDSPWGYQRDPSQTEGFCFKTKRGGTPL